MTSTKNPSITNLLALHGHCVVIARIACCSTGRTVAFTSRRPLDSKRQQCKCRRRDRACNTHGWEPRCLQHTQHGWEPRAASCGFGRRRGSARGERASHAVAADAAAMCVPLCCRLGGGFARMRLRSRAAWQQRREQRCGQCLPCTAVTSAHQDKPQS